MLMLMLMLVLVLVLVLHLDDLPTDCLQATHKKPYYQIDSRVSIACKGLTGGLGRNRTTDTRIFNPYVLVFAIVDYCR